MIPTNEEAKLILQGQNIFFRHFYFNIRNLILILIISSLNKHQLSFP